MAPVWRRSICKRGLVFGLKQREHIVGMLSITKIIVNDLIRGWIFKIQQLCAARLLSMFFHTPIYLSCVRLGAGIALQGLITQVNVQGSRLTQERNHAHGFAILNSGAACILNSRATGNHHPFTHMHIRET